MNVGSDPPLHGLAIYNPRLLSKDELIRTFVARHDELDRIVDALRREVDEQPQHHLVVGARGMGKTTLLNRLRYAIAEDDTLRERCLGLVFPEEQYNIGTLADFWLNCVDALADELESSGRLSLLEGLDEQVARIQGLTQALERRTQALTLLCELADRLERRLVLLVDNVDLVLDRLEDEQWTLREVLSEERRIQLVGATSAPLESYYRHDRAFYDFFRVHHLVGLTEEETFTVLRGLSQATGNAHVEALLDQDPGRIKTIRVMAGGNPRTVVMLFSLLASSSEGDVRADIERLLDLCTPLYKHRVEVLSTQAQRVLDALALHWSPATAAELAKAMHLKTNIVSTQLDRLVKDGIVEKVRLPDTKKHGFQIAERFFNIWCLMRASRRVRRRLVWLVEFLRLMLRPQPPRDRTRYADEAVVQAQAAGLHAREPDSPSSASDRELVQVASLAKTLVVQGRWTDAESWCRRILAVGDAPSPLVWQQTLQLFTEVVTHHFIPQARRLLADANLGGRWEPLDRALELLEHHDLAALGRLAPEMRAAVTLVLERIAPDALDVSS
ncbi:MAG: AAA family ATPase [Nannocystaceae bacterium]